MTLRAVGRPQVVYGRPCPADQLEHEVWITEAELLLGASFMRSAPVGQAIADAAFVRGGARFFVEVDNQTLSAKQLRKKWQRYGDVDGYILVICHTKARLRRLIRSAERVKSVALFTRFRWLQSARVTEPWVDWHGKRAKV